MTEYRPVNQRRKVPYCQQPLGSGNFSCRAVMLLLSIQSQGTPTHHWVINQNNSWQLYVALCTVPQHLKKKKLWLRVSSPMASVEKIVF